MSLFNLTKEKYFNHKNDKIYYNDSFLSNKIFIYVTKVYKIVKVENNEFKFILNLNEFFEIISIGYLESYLKKKKILRKCLTFIWKRNSFLVKYKKLLFFNCPYKKAKTILDTINCFYYSYILNLNQLLFIDNRKEELNNLFVYLERNNNVNNFDNFLKKITENKIHLEMFNRCFNLTNTLTVIRIILLYYVKNNVCKQF